ncbi:MAG: insulinase family protein, partial [Acidobacteriota bacterium]|nr:insulinase family protein [Acidobacteriota bacterium]
LTTYLGALPSTGREESWRDIGVAFPTEPTTFEVRQGLEPLAGVRLALFGDATWNTRQRRRMNLLEDVLQLRLREVLREEQGRTYGVSVAGSLTPYPRPRYRLNLSYSCDPEAVKETLDTLWTELRRLRAEGLPPELVEKAQSALLRERETRLKQNSFWLIALRFYYRYGLDPQELLTYDDLVQSLSAEELHQAAKDFLSEDRYLLGTLRPADPPVTPLLP